MEFGTSNMEAVDKGIESPEDLQQTIAELIDTYGFDEVAEKVEEARRANTGRGNPDLQH